jgi:hypothetical protein
MKYCCHCKNTLPFSSFHASKSHGGYAPRCIECNIKVAGEWYAENKARKQAYDKARREEKRKYFREISLRWWKNNREVRRAEVGARRRRVRQQMPRWTRPAEMKCFYLSAQRVSTCLGIKHVVDHIVPLKGKFVSGLHTPANLRVIPSHVNAVKTNHYSLSHNGVR